MEGQESGRLSALMHAVEPPTGDIDINSVLVAGRRGQRRRRVLLAASSAGLTAAVLVATVGAAGALRGSDRATPASSASARAATPPVVPSVSPSGTASCSIQQLPSPSGVLADVLVADPTGRFQAGQTEIGDNQGDPVLWTDGAPTLLDAPKALLNSSYSVNGINSAGDLAFVTGNATPTAYRYHDGSFTKLPKLAGFPGALPMGMAPNGDIVGWADSGGGTPAAVMWPANQPASVRTLGAPQGRGAMALAIDGEGVIGGSIGDGAGPFVWSANGRGHALKVPAGFHGGSVTALDGQWAVGWVGVGAEGNVVAARWNLSSGKVSVYPDRAEAAAVNTQGDFVGGTGEPGSEGYVFQGGKFELLPAPQADPRTQPRAISADGKTIVGTAVPAPWDSGPTVNLIWHC
jgi:hypothetical protein